MITINNLLYGYSKKNLIYEDLTLHLKPGRITGLLGLNGAGKTTLLKLISGLSFPLSGDISINNNTPKKRKVSFLSDIYFVAEEFYLPSISIKDYILANSVFYPNFDKEKIENTLIVFGLNTSSILTKLSHGQRKKFMIAFAISTQCKLLILDEPTNGLDIPSKTQFRKIIAGSLSEDQLILISTHQVKDIETIIDTILILDQSIIVFNQTIEAISEKLAFEAVSNTDDENILYSESIPSGYKTIKPVDNFSTDIDIELLFNAIISGQKLLDHVEK
jgi:ABC-2 type transport system ATP-binding protein